MKNRNKYLFILAGALVIIGIVIYGSMSLFSKINQVEELNGQLEETAEGNTGIVSSSSSSSPTPSPDVEPEASMINEPTQTPEIVPSTQPGNATPSPIATLTPGPTSDNVDKDDNSKGESTNSEEKSRKKKKIDASVTAKLGSLKSSCQATSNSLVKQIAGELSSNKDATLADIQSKYLNKVFSAESDCDAKFNELISNAKSEYKAADLGDQAFPDWSSQYESAKAQARADALAVIADSIK
ncbi:hypothetical protein [Paenibacillus luteus]|uniref:hypothetical protein n=1 Tax=Paenibacillus luteus TaxID=2545753 RepID=UPI001143217B|nr:hypothetical protein [Paenibacillus luteus]